MPSGHLSQIERLNEVCRDLGWLTEVPHFQEIEIAGHFECLRSCFCTEELGFSDELIQHLNNDMLTESKEAIRMAIVAAARMGGRVRFQFKGHLDSAVKVLASVKREDEISFVVHYFIPTRTPVPTGN